MKDKLWFFGSTHFQRQRFSGSPSTTGTSILPTPNGISQLQAAFPGNDAVAALAAIGPTAIATGNPTFENIRPVTVSDGTTSADIDMGTINRFVPSLFNDYEATGRVDVKVTNKDNFFGRYVFQQNVSTGVGGNNIAAGDWVDVPGRSQQIGLDWSRTWSLTLVNQVRFSFSRRFWFRGRLLRELHAGQCPRSARHSLRLAMASRRALVERPTCRRGASSTCTRCRTTPPGRWAR